MVRHEQDSWRSLLFSVMIRVLIWEGVGWEYVDEFVKHIKRGDQIIINAFTKIDKLNSAELNKLKRDFPDGIFVSNLKKKGIIELQNKITEHLFGN